MQGCVEAEKGRGGNERLEKMKGREGKKSAKVRPSQFWDGSMPILAFYIAFSMLPLLQCLYLSTQELLHDVL